MSPPGMEALRAAVDPFAGQADFDVLLCWSGGRDSTLALDVLVSDLGLRVAAFTFDNTFVAPGAFANIERVLEHLDVHHTIVAPQTQAWRAALGGGKH